MAVTSICIFVGARPNFMKVAPLVRVLQNTPAASYSLVYAGSCNDPTLEDQLFDDLQLHKPHVCLGVDSVRLNEITSRVMAELDSFLDSNKTDVVVVVDDLASTMAAAIVAKKRGLKLAHLVAGTRSFDPREPKETNRLVIDALSDYLFTAGVRSSSVATREQQSESSQTFMVGNILMDTLRYSLPRLRRPAIDGLDNRYMVLTLNRRSLLSDTTHLQPLLQQLADSGITVIAPLRDNAAATVRSLCPDTGNIRLVKPLPYLEFGWLCAHSLVVVTDSGNVAEEATFIGKPCITFCDYTEHQETVSVGTNVLVGHDPQRLSQAMETLFSGQWKKGSLPDRWDGRAAERIVKVLTNT